MATSTSMRRKLLGLIMLGAKMNENHDERGRFSSGSGEGSGSPDVLHLASNPMDKKARVSRSDLEAGSGSGGKKPLGYTPLSNEESGARHEAEKLREHLGTAGSGGGQHSAETAVTAREQRHALYDIDDQDSTQVGIRDTRNPSSIRGSTGPAEILTNARGARAILFQHEPQDNAPSPYKIRVIGRR